MKGIKGLNEINTIRQNLLSWIIIVFVTGIGGEFILYLFFRTSDYFWFYIIGFGIIDFLIIRYLNNKYYSYYRDTIIKPLLAEYGIEYYPNEGLSPIDVDICNILPEYDDFESSDLVKGDSFIASKIILTVEREDEDETTYDEEVFHGSVMICKTPNIVQKCFIIAKNSFHLSDILPVFIDKNRQKLDDVEFEKYFDVYGGDDIEVRKILTHDIMKKLIQLKEVTNFTKIAFFGDRKYVVFEKAVPVVYPWIFTKVTEDTVYKSILGILRFYYVCDFFNKNKI
jgi:hypothetical protein